MTLSAPLSRFVTWHALVPEAVFVVVPVVYDHTRASTIGIVAGASAGADISFSDCIASRSSQQLLLLPPIQFYSPRTTSIFPTFSTSTPPP